MYISCIANISDSEGLVTMLAMAALYCVENSLIISAMSSFSPVEDEDDEGVEEM